MSKIVPGAWVTCNGRYGGAGLIVAVRGTPGSGRYESIGGVVMVVLREGAKVDVVYDDGREASDLSEALLTRDPTPWKVLDRPPAGPEVIAEYLARAAIYRSAEKAKAEEAAAARAALTERLKAEYPDMVGKPAAVNLRTMLKRAFPGVKFSVRSGRGAGVSSIDVKWTGLPRKEEVEAIANRFELGSFNGMDDLYEYDPSPWTDLFGGVRYVFCEREYTREALVAACEKAIAEYGGEFGPADALADLYSRGAVNDHWINRSINEAIRG